MRPGWHTLVGIALIITGVGLTVVTGLEMFGGPHPPLPGDHNVAYLVAGLLIAVMSAWWFGWCDRAQ